MCSRYSTIIIQQIISTAMKWLISVVLSAKNQQLQYESYRAEHLLSNDTKYVKIGQILTELCLPEHSTVGTYRKQENA